MPKILLTDNEYLAGRKLYGDDFEYSQIQLWYKEEENGYSSIIENENKEYQYGFHALNTHYGFKYIPKKKYSQVLGFGSAYGHEIKPIAENIQELTIVDPSDSFVQTHVYGIPTKYIKPSTDGILPFQDCSFELLTCFSCLHHIPNVSFVIRELYRCLSKGGYALIREPIISMGDWNKHRKGLTPHERGIPLEIFRNILTRSQFFIKKETVCIFPPVKKLYNKFKSETYNNTLITHIDVFFSAIFTWNLRYHATSRFHKIRPTSVFYVLIKQ